MEIKVGVQELVSAQSEVLGCIKKEERTVSFCKSVAFVRMERTSGSNVV